MCTLAILYKTAKNAPILVAANREEFFERPTLPPKIQSGSPRVICGIDQRAGGTWFGVNQHGLFATVTNRPKNVVPRDPRSRGVLCRELLQMRDNESQAIIQAGGRVHLTQGDPVRVLREITEGYFAQLAISRIRLAAVLRKIEAREQFSDLFRQRSVLWTSSLREPSIRGDETQLDLTGLH